jgi:hypothetical protein
MYNPFSKQTVKSFYLTEVLGGDGIYEHSSGWLSTAYTSEAYVDIVGSLFAIQL